MTVPDLWFSATTGVLSRLPDGAYARVGFTFELRTEFPPCDPNELPADAVGPLGDVAALREQLRWAEYDRANAQAAGHMLLRQVKRFAALRAEVRAVVDSYDNGEIPDKLIAFDRIRVISDRAHGHDADPAPTKEKPCP